MKKTLGKNIRNFGEDRLYIDWNVEEILRNLWIILRKIFDGSFKENEYKIWKNVSRNLEKILRRKTKKLEENRRNILEKF